MSTLAELIDRGILEKGVSRQETRRISDALPTFEGNTLRRAILVIGYSFDPTYRKVIEPYLHYAQKPSVAAEALNVLAKMFELAPDYLGYVREGLTGYEWDEFGTVQQECLIAAAYILRRQPQHADLAEHIYNQLVGSADTDPDVYAADAAQIALGATSRERAITPFEGPPDLAERFRQRFLATRIGYSPAA